MSNQSKKPAQKKLKAISIREPWAWAILHAGKDIENRSWRTHFRGVVVIHAASGMTKAEYAWGAKIIMKITGLEPPPWPMAETRGCIVGLVNIVDCVEKSKSKWFGGDYGFVLNNPRSLAKPIPCAGALGFWDVPVGVAKKIQASVKPEKSTRTRSS